MGGRLETLQIRAQAAEQIPKRKGQWEESPGAGGCSCRAPHVPQSLYSRVQLLALKLNLIVGLKPHQPHSEG